MTLDWAAGVCPGVTRILLADDHEVVRAGIRRVVEQLPDLQVVGEVGDGPTLLAEVAEHRPDLLLVDVSMPNFDPIMTISRIRAENPDIKILILSAYDDSSYVRGLLKVGVNGYHLKEQSLSNLKIAIERVLAGEQWLSRPLVSKLVEREPRPKPVPELTPRQLDIMRLLQEGMDNRSIALEMDLSVKTIENHLTRIYRQLDVQSRLEAVSYINQNPEILGVRTADTLQAPRVQEPERTGIAILVVDDNYRYLRQMHQVLARSHPHAMLYEADSIELAVRLATQVQPRLVLVDVVLGDEDGIACARRIKAVSSESRIIMISAYPDREFHRLSIEAGAVAFLDKKDLDAKTLGQVVDDVL